MECHYAMKEYLKTTAPGIYYKPDLNYIKKNTIPMKELFFLACLCQYHHLWNLDTTRAKAGHACIETFIKNSTGDLLTVFDLLSLAVNTQIILVHESIDKDTMKKLVNVPKAFIPLLGQISTFAIKECKAQFNCITKNFDLTKSCSQTLTKWVGIPCAHSIAETLETGDGLGPAVLHLQWHLNHNPEKQMRDNLICMKSIN
ncbi:hypothetical protein PSTG_04497 [Puccinia striiformis f. sp. tritici PST-78]|uniref:SWIM-type domain-containing protein n=1 Tax=Puccinia striiformis f. sp. tritici PST-78 TaxID=1165861 RepID=A0A0L0VSN0_9BASI|nr:hypothetical protein PSTG_04497 [Puccinia striiformis f. sp. tritici PST-78]